METINGPSARYVAPEVVSNPLGLITVAVTSGVAMEIAMHPWLVDGAGSGLGVAAAVVVAAAAFPIGGRLTGQPASPEAMRLYLLGGGLGTLLCLRASPSLLFINIIAALSVLSLGVAIHRRDAQRPVMITDYALIGWDVAFNGALGAFLIAGRDLPEIEAATTWDKVRRILVGTAIAIPLLLVFGGLFISADEVFGNAYRSVAAFNVPDGLAIGSVLAAFLAWGMLGLLRRAATTHPTPETGRTGGNMGDTELLTIMWLLNSLFAVFVGFQVFELVASHQRASVSYAEQARNGFFQLVVVATCVVAVVLLIDWLTGPAGRRRLRSQHLALLGLTGGVLVSAVVRMGFYVDAYGLTELRVYTSAFMTWIGFLLIWLIRTVLAGRRHRFARTAFGALLGVIVLLNLINPDAVIASYNLDHQARSGPAVDTAYLVSGLSADAIPTLLEHLNDAGDVCAQTELLERLAISSAADIRSWNRATASAHRLLGAAREGLAGTCQSP